MDPVKIIKRAWHILWSYRALWVFGLIISLATTGSGGGGSNSGTRYLFDNQSRQMPLPQDMQRGMEQFIREVERFFAEGPGNLGIPQGEWTALIWIVALFTLAMLALGIVVAVARYVSETAVIRMVDEYEGTDTKMGVRRGFRIGWSRTSWRLFLLDLLVSLPAILLTLALLGAGIGIFFAVKGGRLTFNSFNVTAVIGVVFVVVLAVAVLSVFLRLLRHFFWRVSVLENLGVTDSLRRGWELVRGNWKSVGLMWLVMIGLGIVWAIASALLVIITLPLVYISAAIIAIPVMLLYGLFGMFLSDVLAWTLGILFTLPLFLIMAFFPTIVLGGWQAVFTSSVWTLTYREIKALPNGRAEADPVPAAG